MRFSLFEVALGAGTSGRKRTAALPGTTEQRAADLFRNCLIRPPTAKEKTALIAFYLNHKKRLQSGELNAATIAGAAAPDAVERAAWTLVARVVFNLDEMITKE